MIRHHQACAAQDGLSRLEMQVASLAPGVYFIVLDLSDAQGVRHAVKKISIAR